MKTSKQTVARQRQSRSHVGAIAVSSPETRPGRIPQPSERSRKMTAEEKTKPITDLFDQATKNYEQLLKSGIKLQQDSAKWLTNVVGEAGSPEIQKKIKGIADDLIPQAQK